MSPGHQQGIEQKYLWLQKKIGGCYQIHNLESMIKRVLGRGIRADYILMDSWFSLPSLLPTFGQCLLPVICMTKNMPNVFYRFNRRWVTLGRLFDQLIKYPAKARILASVVVETKKGQKLQIVLIRHHQKRKWLDILSTKVDLADEEIVRIYSKRWDIEVFFKMTKHYLNLEGETKLRDYDGMVGHITIAMSRYTFLAFGQRYHDAP